jgi:hypothetical protein
MEVIALVHGPLTAGKDVNGSKASSGTRVLRSTTNVRTKDRNSAMSTIPYLVNANGRYYEQPAIHLSRLRDCNTQLAYNAPHGLDSGYEDLC